MLSALARHFLPVTEEERRLLAGEKLQMAAYTDDASATIKGSRLIPRERMIVLRPHTRFTAFPPHNHDYVEIMYMLSGQTVHTLADGERIVLRAGQLLLINRRASHSIEVCGREDVAVNFIVQTEFFDFALEMVGTNNALGCFLLDALRNGQAKIPYLYFPVEHSPDIQALLESMVEGFVNDSSTERIRRVEMGLLFLHLLSTGDRIEISTGLRNWNALAVELLSEVEAHYADFRLTDFAARHRLSAAYVSRVAREATGRTCTELLQKRRLDKACQLLRDTDQSVASICGAVGYSNSSYFYRLFERCFRMSPADYRRSHRT